MRGLYLGNVVVHLCAAMLWLGGMFFFALVGAPVLRRVEPGALRAQLFQAAGERFRFVGWSCIAVLVVTGLLNLHFRGVLNREALAAASFWSSPYGHALVWKLAGVTAMIGISALHDFVHGPAATRLQPNSPEALRARRRATLWARFNAAVGVVVVIAAVRLARGG